VALTKTHPNLEEAGVITKGERGAVILDSKPGKDRCGEGRNKLSKHESLLGALRSKKLKEKLLILDKSRENLRTERGSPTEERRSQIVLEKRTQFC